jgi:CyaY protein
MSISSDTHPVSALSDIEYHRLASEVLAKVEAQIDRWLEDDVIDIDPHRTGGLLELLMPDGSKVVLNTQPPLQEIWLAAPSSGGYHFHHEGGRWLDRESREFFAMLGECLSRQAGRELRF